MARFVGQGAGEEGEGPVPAFRRDVVVGQAGGVGPTEVEERGAGVRGGAVGGGGGVDGVSVHGVRVGVFDGGEGREGVEVLIGHAEEGGGVEVQEGEGEVGEGWL